MSVIIIPCARAGIVIVNVLIYPLALESKEDLEGRLQQKRLAKYRLLQSRSGPLVRRFS
jgi:hypothetical protein